MTFSKEISEFRGLAVFNTDREWRENHRYEDNHNNNESALTAEGARVFAYGIKYTQYILVVPQGGHKAGFINRECLPISDPLPCLVQAVDVRQSHE